MPMRKTALGARASASQSREDDSFVGSSCPVAIATHDAKSEGYVRDLANKRHPGFHKTDSIDYAIVLSGEIWALMDEGEVLLKTGDVLVQRGTNHAWSNRTEQPCCVVFVLIDARPV